MPRDLLVALALFLLTAAIYRLSPLQTLADSHYTMLVSTSLIEDRTFALDRFIRPPLDPAIHPGLQPDGLPGSLRRVRGHVYHNHPPGSAILSLPFVAIFRAVGLRPATASDGYDPWVEGFMQRAIASLLMAAWTAVAYAGARAFLSPGPGAAVALVAALGSPIWSTASRALWSQTWQVLLVMVVLAMLLWEERDGRRFPAWWMGTLLAWAFWVRPSAAPMIAGVAVFLALRDGPRRVLAFLAGGAPWAIAFVWYSMHNFGTLVPDYYRGSYIQLHAIREGLPATLVSPSRGLLVFCPVLVALAFLCVRHWRRIPARGLAWLVVGVIAVHLWIVGSNIVWWGGHCYGPRLHTDMAPWLVTLATLTLAAVRAEPEPSGVARRWRLAVLGTLSAWGIAVHGWGAVEPETARWNYLPSNVDVHQDRLWSWREAQFLAGLPGAAARRRLEPVDPGARIRIGSSPAGDPYVVEGWGASDERTRWSRASRAVIGVPGCRPECRSLVLRMIAFAPQGGTQQVEASIDGDPAGVFSVRGDVWEEIALPLRGEPPAGRVRELVLSFPEAVPMGDDRIGVRVKWMELR